MKAQFDLSSVQVNKYNKLNIEVFSRVEEPIEIQRLLIKFNESSLNQEITQRMVLSKDTPIKLERELYISKDN